MVAQVIQSWNDLHSANRKVVLLPLRWETHTAPEYGVRPQESINRAIVNDCDLLVGIFWTRIGSPTGVADSGTLEEIDRVGKAGKPVMLYFSRVPVDPEGIDLRQVEKLKEFRLNTYPKGLVESYRNRAEFRDKVSRQLEIKVRELQESERSGRVPLSFNLISAETGQPVGSKLVSTIFNRMVTDLDKVPADQLDAVEALIKRRKKIDTTIPIIVGLENSSSVAIRNLFAEITIKSNNSSAKISDRGRGLAMSDYMLLSLFKNEDPENTRSVDSIFADYESEGFREIDGTWRLSAECKAIQPQRHQLLKPAIFLTTEISTNLHFDVSVYSDSLPTPSNFNANLEVRVESQEVRLDDLIPDWEERVRSPNSNDNKFAWRPKPS